ncbi:MAG: RnfABCDGE type electron transport complex subunit A [Acetobacteraceae bacterium]|nr:RnfABCDGE type electron transport complex subunit A [Acetobacteraceae bacterium]
MRLLAILLSGLLVNNFVLVRFLGLCPFLGVSRTPETAWGMSLAVIFVLTLASGLTWGLEAGVLRPLGLGYLRTAAFVLLIAALVQLVEIALQRGSPRLYRALGIYLPLITTNCAVLGSALLNLEQDYGLLEALAGGLSGGAGWALAILLFSGIRRRLEAAEVPRPLRGLPLAFFAAGLMSIAFLGFLGLAAGLVQGRP